MKLNPFQKAVATTYGFGDYAHLTEHKQVTEGMLEDIGDTLFVFLMRELADEGRTAMDAETAAQRIENAVRDCELALVAIQKVHP